jgi:type IV fimbrial biogenesis protein FimT
VIGDRGIKGYEIGVMKGMMNNRGMTLIELLIVITIIGVLVTALSFTYQGWVSVYKVESQTKEMYIDLINTRARAMQRNLMYFVNFTATEYDIYEDTNNNGLYNAGPDLLVSQRILETRYPVLSSVAGIAFNAKGLSNSLNNKNSICSNAPADANNADYNCITISTTRVKMGKLTLSIADGGACADVLATAVANCVEK